MSSAIFIDRRGMRPSATTWGWIEGYRLCFDLPIGPGERGVANLVPEDAARTYGVLYRITADEGVRLDRSEGVPGGFYKRIAVVATPPHGEQLDAFTYLSAYASAGRKPSPRYMNLLLDGAREYRLPAQYVDFLQSFGLARDERPEQDRHSLLRDRSR